MVSNLSSTTPALHADGSITAVIRDVRPLAPAGVILRLWLPLGYDAGGGFGRYFLVRCTEDTPQARRTDWSIYNRRALFCAAMPVAMPDQAGSTWEVLVPAGNDPGHGWLANRLPGNAINLFGPYGQPFELTSHTRALLVLADPQTLPLVLPIVHTMLDKGGRVTLLIVGQVEEATTLLPLIPIPVEARILPADSWLNQLAEPVRWADQLCAVLPNHLYAPLAHQIRTLRFKFDTTFAHVLVSADLLCGVGACLACAVATHDGSYTRACIHGPVFPLTAVAS